MNTDKGTDEIENDENEEKKDEPQRRRGRRERHRISAPLINTVAHG
jgi:hypothetical protein